MSARSLSARSTGPLHAITRVGLPGHTLFCSMQCIIQGLHMICTHPKPSKLHDARPEPYERASQPSHAPCLKLSSPTSLGMSRLVIVPACVRRRQGPVEIPMCPSSQARQAHNVACRGMQIALGSSMVRRQQWMTGRGGIPPLPTPSGSGHSVLTQLSLHALCRASKPVRTAGWLQK